MNIRLTKKRQLILALLQRHKSTLSAAEIHQQLPDIDLVTIYRTLELFTKERLIKQFHLTGSEAQYEHQAKPHHHAVCTDCKKVIHFQASDKAVVKALGLTDFEISDVEVTVRGTCKADTK